MKITVILTLCISLLFCSCGGGHEPVEYLNTMHSPYAANVTISEDGVDYTARVVLDADGVLDIVFASPAMLWGMGYSFDGEDSYLIYNDMSIDLELDELEEGVYSGVFRWRNMLECNGEYVVKKTSLNDKSVIMLSNGECEVYFDIKEKTPLMFKTDKTTITVNEWESKNANNNVQTQDVLADRYGCAETQLHIHTLSVTR